MNTPSHKSGYVALIGRPNAGKSTLLNTILETKLVAVSPRPQTTRNRIFGIYDREDVQIVFQDTPGLLDPKDGLHEFMVREAEHALADANVCVWLIDTIKGMTDRERAIAKHKLTELDIPLLAVFNKIDKVEKDQLKKLIPVLEGFAFKHPPAVFFISALLGDGVSNLLVEIVSALPEGPKFFPSEQLSDKTQRFFIEETIREKAFLLLREEIPYSLAVQVEEMKEKTSGPVSIRAVIHVERDSQKGIVVGQQGRMIKQIGTDARKEIESILGTQVYLELWVKVSERWRKRENQLRELGYSEK